MAVDPQKVWLRRLRRLNPNIQKARGDGAARFAPHKPLLLLALIDAAEDGEVTEPLVTFSAGLRLRFNALWQVVARRWTSRPDPFLPFHYLSSQGFWRPLRLDGTLSESPDSTRRIELHPEFFQLLQQPAFRALARFVLIDAWFPAEEQIALRASLSLEPASAETAAVMEDTRHRYEATGRDARFRIQVIVQYHYTCALTGYSLTTTQTGATIVEAAHIAAFADTRNNDPRNGLALTPDAHWSFDEGLWTIDDDLRVVVAADSFVDSSPDAKSLKTRHGRPLHFATRSQLRPDLHCLGWHRHHRFVG